MRRTCMAYLEEWLHESRRKPLVIRGARQVGKTWAVRHLAEVSGMQLIEINFERRPEYANLFDTNDPHIIIRKIETKLGVSIDIKKTILFLDEIQEKPELFAKLRWFYEDIPELAVITAGSLLEFFFGTHKLHMPVGRVSFMYLEPLSFIEFLQAKKANKLVELIQSFTWKENIDTIFHNKLMGLFKEYLYIGGLPAAVANWTELNSLAKVKDTHLDLLNSYRADFNKYEGKSLASTLNDTLDAIPLFLGKKFVYSQVESTSTPIKIKEALNQLCQARISHKVRCSAANGVPLGGEVNHKFLKAILLDVGLCSAILDLNFNTLADIEEIDMINKGGIAEQVTGQLLRTSNRFNVEPGLYYWIRHEKGSDAEIDYVIQHHHEVVPIEVKAGSTGTLKSLHLFMKQKNLSKAVRVYSGLPGITDVNVKDNQGSEIKYQLRSMPFYLISEIHRLLE